MTECQDPAGALAAGAVARFGGVRAARVVECVDVLAEPEKIGAGGWWAVVGEFDGPVRAWRFAEVERLADDGPGSPDGGSQDEGHGQVDSATGASATSPRATSWSGPTSDAWRSSMDRAAYEAAVVATRESIREGEVYQVNVCRVLSAALPRTPTGDEPDARALADVLARGNPAPYAGYVHVPRGGAVPGVWVVSASPELYLRRSGERLESAPIKGTARDEQGLQDKDRAENVMITDLVRNDLQRVCAPGTVDVTSLLAIEHHPGLVHLVSTVAGELRPDVLTAPDAWGRIVSATYPPGSVSGAPKSSALRAIDRLEPVGRGPYCGAVGWIDADRGTAELAVAIRTFWWDDEDGGTLRFGTGAGITWGSDPAGEWHETELKASRLVSIASQRGDWGA